MLDIQPLQWALQLTIWATWPLPGFLSLRAWEFLSSVLGQNRREVGIDMIGPGLTLPPGGPLAHCDDQVAG